MGNVEFLVGTSDFEKARKNNGYYVDKTGLILSLLMQSTPEVTLITRPRRFGKTMGMSMLATFFDIRKDSQAMFEGLEISKNAALCSEWMNQWPTLFLSLKGVEGKNFAAARERLQGRIASLCRTHRYLSSSEKVDRNDLKDFQRLADRADGDPTDDMLSNSVALMMQMMQDHFGKPVILLIDEYDVPLAKASENGYYKEMLELVKGLMGDALKDNANLKFAVITGCLRIAKESIFTGTNNFVSDTISSSNLNEYFGFTQAEVDTILMDIHRTERTEEIRNWYDGYHFGDLDVYCPWDVMNYVRDLQKDPQAKPASYWKNTSGNEIIRSFIDYAGENVAEKLERLLSGDFIIQKIREDLTYDYLHSSEENLWSVLYLTGYLTLVRDTDRTQRPPKGSVALKIPNMEVQEVFEDTIQEWFDQSAQSWNRSSMFDALWSGDSERLTAEMNDLLNRTISYHDYKEDFYHAFLAGILAGAGYSVESNREHGEGRSDIVVYNRKKRQVAIFEAKYAKSLDTLQESCTTALRQIKDREYAKEFEGKYDSILRYGIAYYKKRCLVLKSTDTVN